MIWNIFNPSHNLPYAKPSRMPPDAVLFPRYLQNAQGLWLRYAEWWPGDGVEVKGVVFIVSGLGEYTGRYDSLALRLNAAGYAVFSMDNQGAGGSEGVRLYVERFSHFVDDIQLFVHHIGIQHPQLTLLPRFLFGHSMGGLIATLVALRDPAFFKGVVLSGPAYAAALIQPSRALRAVSRVLSKYVPRLPVAFVNKNNMTRNPPALQLLMQDPFYTEGWLRVRFGEEMFAAQDLVFKSMAASTFPFLMVFGECDYLCRLERARDFYTLAKSEDKDLKTYPGAYHDLITDQVHETVVGDILQFMNKRCAL